MSGDSSDHFTPEYTDFRAMPLTLFGGNGNMVDRLIEKMFNYLTSPINWMGKKANNSKNRVFRKLFEQISLLIENIGSIMKRKTDIKKLFLPLYFYEKENGKKLLNKIRNFFVNFRNDLSNAKIMRKIKSKFGELFLEFLNFGNVLKTQEKYKPEEIEMLLNKKTSENEENKEKTEKQGEQGSEPKNTVFNVINYIKETMTSLSKNLFKNRIENDEENVWSSIESCVARKNEMVWNF